MEIDPTTYRLWFMKPPLATAWAASCNWPVHQFVCLFVCLSVCRQNTKTRFSQKLSNLKLWCLWQPIESRTWAFQRTHYWTHKIQDGGNPPSWNSTWRHFFLPSVVRFGIKFRGLVQNDMSTAVIWPKSKPEVEFQYGGRLGEFNGMSSQSHLLHCRVLPPGEFIDMSFQSHVSRCRVVLLPLSEFTVMIPEPHTTLHGAVTWRNQCHDRATLQGVATWQNQCHDPIATCHIAGCKNSIRRIENRLSPYFIQFCFLNAVWALTSGGFRIVSDTHV